MDVGFHDHETASGFITDVTTLLSARTWNCKISYDPFRLNVFYRGVDELTPRARNALRHVKRSFPGHFMILGGDLSPFDEEEAVDEEED